MPLAPIVATQLVVPGATGPWSLELGGVNVLKGASGFGVPIESVALELAAPGQVSTLTLTLEDPAGTFPRPAVGTLVRLFDLARGYPVFAGFWQTPTVRRFGLGRAYDVTIVGVESLLDWAILPAAVTIPAATYLRDAVQMLCAAAAWPMPGVNWTAVPLGGSAPPTQANPVSGFGTWVVDIANPVTIAEGTTLRSALSTCGDKWRAGFSGDGSSVPTFTIDPWLGLRAWAISPPTFQYNPPSDLATLVVSAAAMPALAPADLADTEDGGAAVRALLVRGTGTFGWTVDGSSSAGLPGRFEYLSDSTITSDAARVGTALSRIAPRQNLRRGSFRLEAWDPADYPTGYIAPFALVQLTDGQVGIAGQWLIGQLDIAFRPDGNLDALITYGADPPSDITALSWT